MNVCYYSIRKHPEVPDHWNLRFEITPKNALNPFDVGDMVLLCISEDRCLEEVQAMESLGYEMQSATNVILKSIFG